MSGLYDDKKNCFGCGACAAACPVGAVSMEQDSEGFFYPKVDDKKCVGCGKCSAICPAKSKLPQAEGDFYAVRCGDDKLLKASTSGGAFSLIANAVLDEGGLVCGAAFDEDLRVRHILSEDIAPMRKSKYVQSDIMACYKDIREALDAERTVLFCGTPCQCHAIRQFFVDFRDQLVLVSLLCRGVQSPGLWRDYAEWLGRDGKLESYDFRDKTYDNDGCSVSIVVGGNKKVMPWLEDGLSRMYHLDLTLRPSCYACPYTRADNDFDFSIGDFRGEGVPESTDGRGLSLVISHSEHARQLMEKIKPHAMVVPCEKDRCMQPALHTPAKEHFLRRFYLKDYARKDSEGRSDMSIILKKYTAVDAKSKGCN